MYGNVISCDCHSMPCSFVIIGSGNSLNIAVECQSTNAMRFFCNFSHKHIPSTPLRGQPRSPSIPHAAASSARVMQTRPHPRAATLSASFRDEVLSAPPRPVAPYQAQARERPRRGGGRGAGGRTQAMQAMHPPPPRRGHRRRGRGRSSAAGARPPPSPPPRTRPPRPPVRRGGDAPTHPSPVPARRPSLRPVPARRPSLRPARSRPSRPRRPRPAPPRLPHPTPPPRWPD